jgi:hypothetical protein
MIKKLINWIKLLMAGGILGMIEVILKFIKEVLTLIVDILFPIIPNEAFKKIVLTIRTIINQIYDWISRLKEKLVKI